MIRKRSLIFTCLGLLEPRDKRKILLISMTQVLLATIDLAGVLLVGVVGSLIAHSGESVSTVNFGGKILEVFGITGIIQSKTIFLFAGISTTLLVLRTVASIVLTRRILYFFGIKSKEIANRMMERLFRSTVSEVEKYPSQEVLYAVTTGVDHITLQVLATSTVLVSDLFLVLLFSGTLVIIDPELFLMSSTLILTVVFFLIRVLFLKARDLGKENSKLKIQLNKEVLKNLVSFRELFVKNRISASLGQISTIRMKLAANMAEMSFLPFVSKYLFELTVMLGGLLILCWYYALGASQSKIYVLLIFITASSRLAPAILRLQQGLVQIRGNLGQTLPTLDLDAYLRSLNIYQPDPIKLELSTKFTPRIVIKDLSFRYDKNSGYELQVSDVLIEPGAHVVIRGSSGSGKSTLVDLMLGVLTPDSGFIEISGLPPRAAINAWPDMFGYVPQAVTIFDGTFRENITMGYNTEDFNEEHLWKILRVTGLDELVETFPDRLETQIGDRGTTLSGGQRQRIGLARALVNLPELLILDESTNALDIELENDIVLKIMSFLPGLTLIVITHREILHKSYTKVLNISNGAVLD